MTRVVNGLKDLDVYEEGFEVVSVSTHTSVFTVRFNPSEVDQRAIESVVEKAGGEVLSVERPK